MPMKSLGTVAGVVLPLAAAVVLSAAQAGTAAQRFSWLEGCWAGERGGTSFREIWTVASPELLIGMGTTTVAGKPTEFDYFRIERRGEPVYVAQPRGAPPTTFTLQASSPAEAPVFTNPAHDFPKRISYRRVDRSTLFAFVDSGEGSAARLEFPMKRVPCPGTR
jgi:hypothetical protein